MPSTDAQQAILDAVQSVIVRDGVQGTSMRQVAEQADVSLGLISYHFDDKESLIRAAFERATDALLAASQQAASVETDAVEKVRAFLRGAFTDEFLDGDYLRLRVALWSVAMTDPGLQALDAEFFERYAAEYTALLSAACPELDDEACRSRTVDVVALSNGVWLNWARYRNRGDLERGMQRCDDIALG